MSRIDKSSLNIVFTDRGYESVFRPSLPVELMGWV